MAKELPYFKFEPGIWDTGNIQLCTHEEKGMFIGICSMYWQRVGDLPYKLALQKACNGNATALKSLVDEGVVKVIEGMICIDFLNEQLSEFGNISTTNSENARSGWEKRRKNATALPPQSDPNASREEKKRGEERREEEKKEDTPADLEVWPSFENFWDKYDKKVGKPNCEIIWKKIEQAGREKIMTHLDNYLQVEKQYRKDPERYLKKHGWLDEVITKPKTLIPNAITANKREQHNFDLAQDFAKRALERNQAG